MWAPAAARVPPSPADFCQLCWRYSVVMGTISHSIFLLMKVSDLHTQKNNCDCNLNLNTCHRYLVVCSKKFGLARSVRGQAASCPVESSRGLLRECLSIRVLLDHTHSNTLYLCVSTVVLLSAIVLFMRCTSLVARHLQWNLRHTLGFQDLMPLPPPGRSSCRRPHALDAFALCREQCGFCKEGMKNKV